MSSGERKKQRKDFFFSFSCADKWKGGTESMVCPNKMVTLYSHVTKVSCQWIEEKISILHTSWIIKPCSMVGLWIIPSLLIRNYLTYIWPKRSKAKFLAGLLKLFLINEDTNRKLHSFPCTKRWWEWWSYLLSTYCMTVLY